MNVKKMKALGKEVAALLAAGDRTHPSIANYVTSLQEENVRLRKERDRWQQVAEEESWPFEWEVATGLKQERDKLQHCVVMLAATLEEIKLNCNTVAVFDEDGETSSFPDDMKRIVDIAVVDFSKAIGIDFTVGEA